MLETGMTQTPPVTLGAHHLARRQTDKQRDAVCSGSCWQTQGVEQGVPATWATAQRFCV